MGWQCPLRVQWASLCFMVNTYLPGFNIKISIIYCFCTFACILTELQSSSYPLSPIFPILFLYGFFQKQWLLCCSRQPPTPPFPSSEGCSGPRSYLAIEARWHMESKLWRKTHLETIWVYCTDMPLGTMWPRWRTNWEANSYWAKVHISKSCFRKLCTHLLCALWKQTSTERWNVWKTSLVACLWKTLGKYFAINASCKYCEWEPVGKNVWDDKEPASLAKECPSPYTSLGAPLLTHLLPGMRPQNQGWWLGAEEGQPAMGPSGLASYAAVTERETHSGFLGDNATNRTSFPFVCIRTSSDSKSSVPDGKRPSTQTQFSLPDDLAVSQLILWCFQVKHEKMEKRIESIPGASLVV